MDIIIGTGYVLQQTWRAVEEPFLSLSEVSNWLMLVELPRNFGTSMGRFIRVVFVYRGVVAGVSATLPAIIDITTCSRGNGRNQIDGIILFGSLVVFEVEEFTNPSKASEPVEKYLVQHEGLNERWKCDKHREDLR